MPKDINMLRRSHKKSRQGCLECKQRHIKCDESRPLCMLCNISGRACSYASQASSREVTTDDSSDTPSISLGQNHKENDFTVSEFTSLVTSSLPNHDLPPFPDINNQHPDSAVDVPLNLNHMELLIHTLQDPDLFSLSFYMGTYLSNMVTAFTISLEAPYLLHQILAFSARHLASLHPERSAFYSHQSVSFQTRAISLFNASWSGVDKSNCMSLLLFSSILGHHILADTLARRDAGGLETFMFHFIQCVDMHKGIYAIARAAWPLLMETELEPLLSWSSEYNSRLPRGNHCQHIRELIDATDGFGEEEKEECRTAIQYLQIGLDAVLADDDDDEEEVGNRYHTVSSWTMLLQPKLKNLLAAKRPEALVLLGYYALLLHYARNLWQVGDAGAYMLRIILDYLDPEWSHWLEYPQEVIAKTSGG